MFWEGKGAPRIRKEALLQTPSASSFLALVMFSLGNRLLLVDLFNR